MRRRLAPVCLLRSPGPRPDPSSGSTRTPTRWPALRHPAATAVPAAFCVCLCCVVRLLSASCVCFLLLPLLLLLPLPLLLPAGPAAAWSKRTGAGWLSVGSCARALCPSSASQGRCFHLLGLVLFFFFFHFPISNFHFPFSPFFHFIFIIFCHLWASPSPTSHGNVLSLYMHPASSKDASPWPLNSRKGAGIVAPYVRRP